MQEETDETWTHVFFSSSFCSYSCKVLTRNANKFKQLKTKLHRALSLSLPLCRLISCHKPHDQLPFKRGHDVWFVYLMNIVCIAIPDNLQALSYNKYIMNTFTFVQICFGPFIRSVAWLWTCSNPFNDRKSKTPLKNNMSIFHSAYVIWMAVWFILIGLRALFLFFALCFPSRFIHYVFLLLSKRAFTHTHARALFHWLSKCFYCHCRCKHAANVQYSDTKSAVHTLVCACSCALVCMGMCFADIQTKSVSIAASLCWRESIRSFFLLRSSICFLSNSNVRHNKAHIEPSVASEGGAVWVLIHLLICSGKFSMYHNFSMKPHAYDIFH